MYLIFFALILCGIVFHEILSPVCYFLARHQILVFILCGVLLALFCADKARKIGQPAYGFRAFFAISQFLVFALAAIYGIVDTMVTEKDAVTAMLMAVIVGLVFGAYGSFDLKMLKSALDEGKDNPAYLWIVGIVGWAINILFTVL